VPVTRFRVVTDSTSDVPPDWRERFGITVVPLTVQFGGESFQDGVDLTNEEFFDRLRRADHLPTTAAPSPGAFADVYRGLSGQCEGVISIHISSTLSATAEAARLGAQSVDGFPVHVVDSRSLTMCVAFLCRVAAEAPSLEEALERVRERVPRQRVLALLDTLRYVEMGGRVNRAQAMVGSMLDLKPILAMADGEIKPADRVRTRARAVPRLLELLRRDLPVESLAVMHAQAAEEAERLREQLARELPDLEVETGQTGAVLGTHVGPGSLGLTYLRAG
jgi:fatty acid kinase fatty acid binding subunit